MKKKYCVDYWLYKWNRDQWWYVDAFDTKAQAKSQMEAGTMYKIEEVHTAYYVQEEGKEF